jgi:hypothetical protein
LPDIPQVNVSPAQAFQISPDAEDLVRQRRADEFSLWNSIPEGG